MYVQNMALGSFKLILIYQKQSHLLITLASNATSICSDISEIMISLMPGVMFINRAQDNIS